MEASRHIGNEDRSRSNNEPVSESAPQVGGANAHADSGPLGAYSTTGANILKDFEQVREIQPGFTASAPQGA